MRKLSGRMGGDEGHKNTKGWLATSKLLRKERLRDKFITQPLLAM